MTDIQILFEDEQILVVNKPAGIGTQAPRQFDSLEARVRTYLQASSGEHTVYLGIPHRIDRCVSGAIVFAKKRKAAQRLSRQFEYREVEKRYVAIVAGQVEPNSGTWTDFMRKIPDKPAAEIVSDDGEDAKEAILHYEVTSMENESSKLLIKLETGRMHQIRLQCATHGHPIFGDQLYGSAIEFGPTVEHERDRHISLHASYLAFKHPKLREAVFFEAPLPDTWERG